MAPVTTPFAVDPAALKETLSATLGAKARSIELKLGEVTVTVAAADYLEVAKTLRDAPGCKFE
jgi:NADH-quinone oxidoreductase subunit C